MLKLHYITLLTICLLFFLLGLVTCKSCIKTPACPEVKTETSTDTTKSVNPPQETELHIPTLVFEGGNIEKAEWMNWRPAPIVRIDSFILFERMPVDTSAIIKPYVDKYNALFDEWNLLRKYADTNRFNNGRVIIDALVKNNRLQIKSTLDSTTTTTITNTTTKTIPAKQNVVGYLGVRGGYNFSDSSMNLGAAFSLKLKNDWRFGVAGKINTRSQKTAELEVDIPIRLKRKN
jgi:hypothetical protein